MMQQQMVDEAGNIWNVDAAGNPVSFAGRQDAQPQSIQVKPADPDRALDTELKRARLNEIKGGGPNSDLQRSLLAAQVAKAQADAAKAQQGTAGAEAGDIKTNQLLANLRALEQNIQRVRELYQQNLQGGFPNALSGRVPGIIRPENEQFNSAGAGLGGAGLAAFRVPGVGAQSDAELRAFIQANQPVSSDSDLAIEEKLRNLETRLNATLQELGMAPAPQRNVQLAPQQEGELAAFISANTGNPDFGPDDLNAFYAARNLGPPADQNNPEFFNAVRSGKRVPTVPNYGDNPIPYDQTQRDTTLGAVDAIGRNFANMATLNIADRISAAGNAILPLDALTGRDVSSVWDGSTFGQAYDRNMAINQQINAADEAVNPVASFVGDVGGAMTGIGLANRALQAARMGGLVQKTGGAAGDVLFGFASGAAENGPMGALLGGGSALAGGLAGRYLLAPTARAVADTRVGQAGINAARRGSNALGNAGRGLFGKSPVPFTAANIPAPLNAAQNVAVSGLAGDSLAQLDEAASLGLPLALADTAPQLRSLAGSATRKSPDARAMAEDAIGGRALGQADRAKQQIGQSFGTIANPNRVSDDLLAQARNRAAPLYDEFRAQPPMASPEINALMRTPAGRAALEKATSIAANEGRDIFKRRGAQALTPEGLDLVKRGFDDVLEGYRNSITGRLDLDESGRAIEGVRRQFVEQADQLYPSYAQARAAYAGPAGERAALSEGRDALGIAPRDIADRIGNLTPGQRDQYGLGYRVAMADRVDKVRDVGDPYKAIYGAPEMRERAATVFGPEAAARFGRVTDLEGQMSKTAYETLGGSPTASRLAADQAFESGLANAADLGLAFTTGGGQQAVMQKLARGLTDTLKLGVGKRKADQIAPVLLNTDPAAIAAAIRSASTQKATRDAYKKKLRKNAGVFGSAVGASVVPLIQ